MYTIEGVHATLCSILSDAVEGGFLSHNPAWRTYRYAGRKCEKKIFPPNDWRCRCRVVPVAGTDDTYLFQAGDYVITVSGESRATGAVR